MGVVQSELREKLRCGFSEISVQSTTIPDEFPPVSYEERCLDSARGRAQKRARRADPPALLEMTGAGGAEFRDGGRRDTQGAR